MIFTILSDWWYNLIKGSDNKTLLQILFKKFQMVGGGSQVKYPKVYLAIDNVSAS